jgi:hypothetical protein
MDCFFGGSLLMVAVFGGRSMGDLEKREEMGDGSERRWKWWKIEKMEEMEQKEKFLLPKGHCGFKTQSG